MLAQRCHDSSADERLASGHLDGRSPLRHAALMATRLEGERADEQVRVEVELGSDEPLDQVRGLRAATLQLDAWQRLAVSRARERGASWSEIGEALGVTKQAAWALYNADVREALANARRRSRLTDEDAQALADEERRTIRDTR